MAKVTEASNCEYMKRYGNGYWRLIKQLNGLSEGAMVRGKVSRVDPSRRHSRDYWDFEIGEPSRQIA